MQSRTLSTMYLALSSRWRWWEGCMPVLPLGRNSAGYRGGPAKSLALPPARYSAHCAFDMQVCCLQSQPPIWDDTSTYLPPTGSRCQCFGVQVAPRQQTRQHSCLQLARHLQPQLWAHCQGHPRRTCPAADWLWALPAARRYPHAAGSTAMVCSACTVISERLGPPAPLFQPMGCVCPLQRCTVSAAHTLPVRRHLAAMLISKSMNRAPISTQLRYQVGLQCKSSPAVK